ncbi:MAG: copper chaperone [Tepidanaerobacteraceae bacterium]|nr:copper chaperone [Tepidanaerobacteraceae bacterium]
MCSCCNNESVRSDITLKVEGMSCAHCKKAVETSVGALPGIFKVEAEVSHGKVDVSFDPSKVKLDDIKKAIEDAGYDVKE